MSLNLNCKYCILPNCLRWKSFAVVEMGYNLLKNICGCMVVLFVWPNPITQGNYGYFTGKIL